MTAGLPFSSIFTNFYYCRPIQLATRDARRGSYPLKSELREQQVTNSRPGHAVVHLRIHSFFDRCLSELGRTSCHRIYALPLPLASTAFSFPRPESLRSRNAKAQAAESHEPALL